MSYKIYHLYNPKEVWVILYTNKEINIFIPSDTTFIKLKFLL